VIAIRRARSKVAHLDDLAIEWRVAELAASDALAAAFAGTDVVFHCAAAVGTHRAVTAELKAANVTGTQHVIDACIAPRVPRLVHACSVVAIGRTTDGRPCDETASWNFEREGLLDGYAITKHQAEQLVRAAHQRLDAVIVNPTFMFGPRDARPSSGEMIIKV